jgi:putative transposase
MRQLTDVREAFPEYKAVHVHVLQNVIKKLNKAFEAFFRRCKSGEKPGFPRFKSQDRFDSLAFNNVGFALQGNKLALSKIGNIKVRLSRPLPENSKVKALTVKRICGSWYACLAVAYESVALPPNGDVVGVDVGIEKFAATSDGKFIENPKFYQQSQKELRRAQRRVARRKKGSQRRRKAVQLLQKVHERIANRRKDFLHKESTKLVRRYGTIGVENLNIKGLSGGMLAKQVLDASWSAFVRFLSYKAEEAGRKVVEVDCAYTSQTCPACGRIEKKKLSQRIHECECGYTTHRDIAAAQIILGRIAPSGVNVKAS